MPIVFCRYLAAFALVLALTACRTVQPFPGTSEIALWQKQFKALDCWNPRNELDLESGEPLKFAMITICHRLPVKRKGPGWNALVTLDARNGEVKGIPISSIYNGGVHFTSEGHVVWYSSGKIGEAARAQRYVEAYALRHGESQEQLLGRVDVPFLTGPGIGYIEGEGCHLVQFNSYLANGQSPRLRQLFLVKDHEPFTSAKPLEGIGRALFWDPVRRYFVVQKEPYRVIHLPGSEPLDHRALDCSGQMRELDAEQADRLAVITDENAHYLISRQGKLLVGWQKAGSEEPEILVFQGSRIDRIASRQSFELCPDLGCEPLYDLLFAVSWSNSGEHFMIDRGFAGVEVYRAADMKMVKQWAMKGWNDFPAHGFINDHVAYQFNDHGRLTFHTW